MPYGIVELSVPLIVPKARFTHEVRFTSEGHFMFRAAEHLIEKSTCRCKCFFPGTPSGIRTLDTLIKSQVL